MAAVIVALLAACGGGDAGRFGPQVPDIALHIERVLDTGHGILAPNRIVSSQAENVLYIATGRGESFPEGYLHEVDARSLTERRRALEVGRNVSDLLWIGNDLLALSRGDDVATLVDPSHWRKLDRIDVGFAPVAAVALSATRAALVSIDSESMAELSIHDGKLSLDHRVSLPDLASDLVLSADGHTLYVAIHDVGVVAYDAESLKQVGSAGISGSLGKGMIVWHNYVVVSNRDGYLHFVDQSNFTVTTVDVAEALGLSRASLPARAVDCSEVIDLGEDRIAVLDVRERSVIFHVDPSGAAATVLATFPKAVFGVMLAADNRLVLTQPAANLLIEVPLPAAFNPAEELVSHSTETGVDIRAVQILGGDKPAIVALDSQSTLHLLAADAADDRRLLADPGEARAPPLIEGPQGSIGVLQHSGGAETFVLLDREGLAIVSYEVQLPSVFAAAYGHGEIALVSRLAHQVQFIDTRDGSSTIMDLPHDRPRVAAPVGVDSWIFFHDTTPDIGWTLVQNHAVVRFTPFDDWFSSATSLSQDRVATASFAGTVGVMDANAEFEVRKGTGIRGAIAIMRGVNDDLWVTSENLSTAYRLPANSLEAQERYARYGLLASGGLPGTDRVVIATTRTLEIATAN